MRSVCPRPGFRGAAFRSAYRAHAATFSYLHKSPIQLGPRRHRVVECGEQDAAGHLELDDGVGQRHEVDEVLHAQEARPEDAVRAEGTGVDKGDLCAYGLQ